MFQVRRTVYRVASTWLLAVLCYRISIRLRIVLSIFRESIQRVINPVMKKSNVIPKIRVQTLGQNESVQRAVNPIMKRSHIIPNVKIRIYKKLFNLNIL